MKIKIYNKGKSAALIIALIIVTVSSIMLLGLGRTTISSTFVSNRFGDSVIANNLAWSGIEDALVRLRGNVLSLYWPDWGVINDGTSFGYPFIIRRNATKHGTGPVGKTNQIAGYQTAGPPPVVPGINNIVSVLNSCVSGVDNLCDSSWVQSDQYYDVRASGSDDTAGPQVGSQPVRLVNLQYSGGAYSPVRKNGFYKISNTEGTSVDRFFDLSQYRGNTGALDSDQRIGLVFEMSGATIPAGGNIDINFFIKYKNLDTNLDLKNDHLSCKSFIVGPPAQNKLGYQESFWVTDQPAYPTVPVGVQTLAFYTPFSCVAGVGINAAVDYAGVRVNYNGGATGNIYFGLRTSTSLPQNGDSFLGTGVTKLISTGIAGNARKTIEVWAYKNLKLDLNSPIPLCKGVNDGISNLSLCQIKIDKDIKY
ncbi:MAG: hypothetical protein HW405_186 [Candidatus Berkelbacteria bacterium]|nr:hypothetical protein [Candidatus Berkelbacteria bacterium]